MVNNYILNSVSTEYFKDFDISIGNRANIVPDFQPLHFLTWGCLWLECHHQAYELPSNRHNNRSSQYSASVYEDPATAADHHGYNENAYSTHSHVHQKLFWHAIFSLSNFML